MKKYPRLTIGRARELIKRELGLNASALEAPPEKNDNHNLPYFTMDAGRQCIIVESKGNGEGKRPNELIMLTILNENSTRCTHEYFYADTLEYASEYTDSRYYERIFLQIENKDKDTFLRKLAIASRNACQKHLYGVDMGANSSRSKVNDDEEGNKNV